MCFSRQDKSLSIRQPVSTPILPFLEDTLRQEEGPILQHHRVLGIKGQQDILPQGATLPLGATLELPRLEECHLILELLQALGLVCLPLALALVAIHSLLPKAMLEVDQHKFQRMYQNASVIASSHHSEGQEVQLLIMIVGYAGGQAPSPMPGPPAAMVQCTQGTIQAAPNFDAGRDAEILRKAMKGFGTDEQAIINVVANRSNDQRQKIKAAFKTMYGKDLIKDLKSELSGNVEELILALFMPRTYYDAWSLRHAMKGAGTQERVLIEILCTRTNQEIREIVNCYKSEFGRDIEQDIRADTSGHFERLLISMCQGNRDENQTVDYQKAQEDAQRLYQAGEGKLGTDESCFNMVLASRSFPQLKATVEAYSRIANRDLLSSIDREFSGNVERGLKTILQCALNRPAFFAERLYYSMKGAGTDDSTLIRIIVTRSEIDLVQIKQMFAQMYQKTLATMIASDTSGDYRRLLLAIVGQ
ncbi:hypothetical protein QYF61_016535 [Mycteria americana]|uniref:Annexin n=1 Tax=Mycteria americana TaxID=33587 RepID=A0AAN7S6M0_MYCAM|nr:hypothetical protein QYF61_016535 [Mycteria americana]